MPSTCPQCSAEVPSEARFCPRCGRALASGLTSEPEFQRWRRRVVKRSILFCAIAIPGGLLFLRMSPGTTLIVSGLGALGVVVGLIRLSRLPAE